ncbi:MAG TPA: cytochrome P450 [Thermoanaerobaculia bacterium]|nr:cytochrome P450 [Thermoanaerobaculia bacterium]
MSLRDSVRWLRDPYAFLDEAREQRGLTFWMDLALAGRVLVTGDPEVVREIVAHPDLDAGQGIAALRAILGDRSLITLDGEDHAARRRLVGPLFRRDLEALDEFTIAAAREALGEIAPGRTFSVYDLARRISLRAIVRLLFGETSREEAARAERRVDDFLLSFESPWVLFLRPLHVNLGPLTAWGRALRNRRRLTDFLEERITAARRSKAGGGALARIVREGTDLPDDEIVSEILALLLFGHDTGAATLAWAFAHIHRHPEALQKIRDETEEHVYLRACLEESMRLCPVVVHLTRVARRETRIGGETVPAGTRVFPSAYLAQRNPEVFPEPDRFLPERFLEGRTFEGAYFPFGFGARTCIGRHFVMRQMILLTSTILRHADLALLPGDHARPVRRLVLILPEGGTRMVLRGWRP